MDTSIIYGNKGWFWNDGKSYCVVITCHKILNRRFNKFQDFKYRMGDEEIIYLTKGEFVDLKIEKLLDIQWAPIDQRAIKAYHDSRHRNAFYNERGLTPHLKTA